MSAADIAEADQLRAAHEEALRMVLGASIGAKASSMCTPPTPWLGRIMAGVSRPGWARTCNHLRSRPSAQVTWLAVWRRRLECRACFERTVAAFTGTPQARSCAVCGQEFATAPPRTMVAVIDNVIVVAGHCGPCTAVACGPTP